MTIQLFLPDPLPVQALNISNQRSSNFLTGSFEYNYTQDDSRCTDFQISYSCSGTNNALLELGNTDRTFNLTELQSDCHYVLSITAISKYSELNASSNGTSSTGWTCKSYVT